MKKVLPFIVILTLAASSLACSISTRDINPGFKSIQGSGAAATETRSLNDVQAVSLSGIGELEVQYGDEEKVDIEADDNILPYITSEIRNGTLYLGVKDGINIQPKTKIHFTLTVVHSLNAISVSGLGSVKAPQVKADEISFTISGSGDIQVEQADASLLDVDISGLGSLSIKAGEVKAQKTSISGSGNYDAEDVKSDTATVQISGLGSTTIWVTSQLDVSISGSGDVKYYGTPDIKQDISGIGNLESRGEHQ